MKFQEYIREYQNKHISGKIYSAYKLNKINSHKLGPVKRAQVFLRQFNHLKGAINILVAISLIKNAICINIFLSHVEQA